MLPGSTQSTGVRVERAEKPQQVVCYKARDETQGLYLEMKRGSGELMVAPTSLAYLLLWQM